MAQVEDVLLEIIDEPAGRADQHIDAVGQLPALLLVVGAAVDHGGLQPGVLAEDLGIVVDLDGQFARRGDDQGTHRGRGAPRGRRSRQQQVVQRDQERGGLAGAGLGLAGDIPTREGHG